MACCSSSSGYGSSDSIERDVLGEKMRDLGALQETFTNMIDALSLVAKLAALPFTTMRKKQSKVLDDIRDDLEDTEYILSIQNRLDDLQCRQDIKGTSLPILIQSIHRLQSSIAHHQAESEKNSDEIKNLEHSLDIAINRIIQLERAVRELYRENTELSRKLRSKKKESRIFAKTVKEYVALKRQEEMEKDDLYAAACVSMHETILKLNPSKSRGEDETEMYDVDTDHHTTASRLEDFYCQRRHDPTDSSFLYTNLEETALRSSRTSNTDSPTNLNLQLNSLSLSFEYSNPRDRTTSLDSLASNQSRVTDTCIPTVRFDFHLEDEVVDGNHSSQSYTYSFDGNSKLGLVFKLIEIHPSRRPLIDSALLDAIDSNEHTATKNPKSGLVSKIDDLFSRYHHKKKDSALVVDEANCAIVVCGYDDSDGLSNAKPPLGTRLIAIGEESLINKKQLSIEMVHDMIAAAASSNNCVPHRIINLTFRAEPLMRDRKLNQVDDVAPLDRIPTRGNEVCHEMNEKPNFFDKIFPNVSRDQRKEKEQTTEKTQLSHSSNSSLLKRDFFRSK